MKDKSKKAFIKGIYEYAEKLKLPAFKQELELLLSKANESDLTYEELIYILFAERI